MRLTVIRKMKVGCWRLRDGLGWRIIWLWIHILGVVSAIGIWHLDCKSYELPSFWVLRTWMGICLARPGCGWLGGHEMLRSEVKN